MGQFFISWADKHVFNEMRLPGYFGDKTHLQTSIGKGKNDNKPLSQETWTHLKGLVTNQLSGKRLFVVDTFCGANADTRLQVRFVTEVAWQAHFVKNMG